MGTSIIETQYITTYQQHIRPSWRKY